MFSRAAAPGMSGLYARGEGERVLALESREQEPVSNLSHQVPPGFSWGGVSLLWRGQAWGRGSGASQGWGQNQSLSAAPSAAAQNRRSVT